MGFPQNEGNLHTRKSHIPSLTENSPLGTPKGGTSVLKRVFLLVFSLQAVRQVLALTFSANLMKKWTYFCEESTLGMEMLSLSLGHISSIPTASMQGRTAEGHRMGCWLCHSAINSPLQLAGQRSSHYHHQQLPGLCSFPTEGHLFPLPRLCPMGGTPHMQWCPQHPSLTVQACSTGGWEPAPALKQAHTLLEPWKREGKGDRGYICTH